ncbi:nuclear transport factor 2 family protein [Compostimonas suwonensis]|uniref:SnoaL-like protein n=1 Tax=Compostimonas suwonensis TaxID=1048394 RepID=A0A2M9BWA1_9MICO|nr:nuclear transport factor 2 family protein [Compostimonas suwonensis]PJJ62233.1 SnoaL-like protein [Compostimonas suwonensis]
MDETQDDATQPANAELVRRLLSSFQSQDQATAASLLSAGFRFTSPQDDHIDKAEYLAVCFPTADHFAEHRLMEVVEAGDEVLIRYEYVLHDGRRFRNMEAITVRDGLIAEVQVYFGGAV